MQYTGIMAEAEAPLLIDSSILEPPLVLLSASSVF